MRFAFAPAALTLAMVFSTAAASADEGMWTFDNFPSADVKKKYGFAPDQAWLDDVRMSSVRLGNGCSGSFVSKDGLILTNHHCAHGCIDQLSTKASNLVENGFFARTQPREKRCPALEVSRLSKIEDVTTKVSAATKGLSGSAYQEARRAAMSKIEKACATSNKVRCDVVTLYNGGLYHLYQYQRYDDVRLVFAPELAIAFFGGDPDNFNFPRYVLDIAFLRAYQDGKPVTTDHHFAWSKSGAKDGELVFVTGHPGRTNRGKTIAQLEYMRDTHWPNRIAHLSELRGTLTEFGRGNKERARIAKSRLFRVENGLKAFKGRRRALVDPDFFSFLVKREQDLRSQVRKKPEMQSKYGAAWGAIAQAQKRAEVMRLDMHYKENHRGFGSQLLRLAVALVRYADEKEKPNEKRLREFSDAKLPRLEAHLFSKAPIYPQLEQVLLAHGLTKLREELGPDDPFVKKVLGKKSPERAARALIRGTKLRRVAARKRLFAGGKAAVEKSRDPMIVLARLIDEDGRAIRKKMRDEVDSVINKNGELIAKARFEIYGTKVYPDATSSLRLSYGAVEGFPHRGTRVPPFTNIQGAFERATGEAPFALPKRWVRGRKKLQPFTRMNFVSTNDIIGGNSGSPIINKNKEVVGAVFDGNIYSLGGDYGFDPAVNRTVSIHSDLIRTALTFYGAARLAKEIENE